MTGRVMDQQISKRGFIYQKPDTCEVEVADADGELGPCDRPCTGWRWYDGGEHEPMLTRACYLHETYGAEALAALVSERDDLAASVARVEELAESWKYDGRFGHDDGSHAYGPDPEGIVLDDAAHELIKVLRGES